MNMKNACFLKKITFISILLIIIFTLLVFNLIIRVCCKHIFATVGTNPFGIAYDFGKGEIFVANTGSNTVSVISDTTNSVINTVNVGSQPFSVTYDSGKGKIYVTNSGSGTVSIISDTTNSVINTVTEEAILLD